MSEISAGPVITAPDGHWRGDWPDGYAVIVKNYDASRPGIYRAELEVLYQETYLNTLTVDLLSSRAREEFSIAMGALNGITPVVWDSRLGNLYRNLQVTQAPMPAQAPWAQARTAKEFLLHEDQDLDATVTDFLVAGCITIASAPRGSGKSFVALFLGVALAQGGIFRMERLARQRVLLVDRDNPQDLVRKRLRSLGAADLTTLKVLTRESAPPLTDKAAWATFPAEDYDVLIVDSLGAFTEGVSEKEGKQTQEFLATLKNLAARGLAILALANTNKAGTNIRGRGEQSDAVDIVYEARNLTGWQPDDGPLWWESLPEAGEHAWQHNTTRRMNAKTLRIGFVPTKFRLATTPAPFVLEMDTTTTPWSMTDVTAQITHEGTQAIQAQRSAERQKLDAAALALAAELRKHIHTAPMLKKEAETFLCEQGRLKVRQARNLLENGYNRDVHHEGLWVLREIAGQRGHPIGVYLAEHDPRARAGGGREHVRNNDNSGTPHEIYGEQKPISDSRMLGSVRNHTKFLPNEIAGIRDADFGQEPYGGCPKSANVSPAETLGETERVLFRTHFHTPDESCLHEHLDDTNRCNDCGADLSGEML
jgi:AAA domain